MGELECLLHHTVAQAIQETTETDPSKIIHGFIYGIADAHRYHILSSVKLDAPLKSGSFVREFLHGPCELPIGVDPIGIFLCNCDISELSNIIPISSETMLPESLICLHFKEKFEVYKYNRVSKDSSPISYQVTEENPLRNKVKLNLQTELSMKYEFSSKRAVKERNCTSALRELQNSFQLPSTLFEYGDSGIIAGPSQAIGASLDEDLSSVTKKILDNWNEELWKKDRFTEVPVIYLKQLTQITKPFETAEHAPIILYSKLESTIITVQLSLDVVIFASETTKLSEMPSLIHRAVARQFLLYNTLLDQSEAMDPVQLTPIHTWIDKSVIPITSLVPKSSEEVPEAWRASQHSKYMIASDRPCFRRANQYQFEPDFGGMLINPHTSVRGPDGNFSADMIHCVHGCYAYHHYMQDNFNDDKWGCAYRSLQTLISWFRLQGYTEIPLPRHRKIQQTLVDMEDKPSSFVGSKEWIGSIEVGYVLDRLLKVDSKLLYVSSGAELALKGPELVQHFETQGTPIMIGGGVLAHTILGVAYNNLNGEIRFLVLDPHYTGVDDLKTVVDKKWCGWKRKNFWDASVYYNMCMPLRPITF